MTQGARGRIEAPRLLPWKPSPRPPPVRQGPGVPAPGLGVGPVGPQDLPRVCAFIQPRNTCRRRAVRRAALTDSGEGRGPRRSPLQPLGFLPTCSPPFPSPAPGLKANPLPFSRFPRAVPGRASWASLSLAEPRTVPASRVPAPCIFPGGACPC